MRNILYISCSPKSDSSQSNRFAKEFIDQLHEVHASALTTIRDLAQHPIPHISGTYAIAMEKAADKRSLEEQASLELSDTLIEELEATDCLVIATPMHNFTVPSVLKAWIDHVVRAHRTLRLTPQGKVGMIEDKKTFVIVSSGGHHSHLPSWQPNFLTPYLIEIFKTIGITSVEFIYLEAMAHGPEAVEKALSSARTKAAEVIPTIFHN